MLRTTQNLNRDKIMTAIDSIADQEFEIAAPGTTLQLPYKTVIATETNPSFDFLFNKAAAEKSVFDALKNAYRYADSNSQVSQNEAFYRSLFRIIDAVTTPSEPVKRSQRGTIELACHKGRQLTPHYNRCGMLTRVEISDGAAFVLDQKSGLWSMLNQSGKAMNLESIKSVSFDQKGNLIYVTVSGAKTTLCLDGTIQSSFPKRCTELKLPA